MPSLLTCFDAFVLLLAAPFIDRYARHVARDYFCRFAAATRNVMPNNKCPLLPFYAFISPIFSTFDISFDFRPPSSFIYFEIDFRRRRLFFFAGHIPYVRRRASPILFRLTITPRTLISSPARTDYAQCRYASTVRDAHVAGERCKERAVYERMLMRGEMPSACVSIERNVEAQAGSAAPY